MSSATTASPMYDDRRSLAVTLVVAVLLHVAFVAVLPMSTDDWAILDPSVDLELIEHRPDPTPPPPPPELEVPPPPAPIRAAAPPPVEAPPPPEDAPPPPAAETTVAFDNIILTNDTGPATFTIQQASGIDREGPIGRPGQVTGRDVQGSLSGAPGGTGTAVVPVRDLRRPPEFPNLDDALRRNYPEAARLQGVPGVATVKIRIRADGSVTVLRVASETPPDMGFGQACRRTVHGIDIPPVIGPSGDRVETIVDFRCDFRVR